MKPGRTSRFTKPECVEPVCISPARRRIHEIFVKLAEQGWHFRPHPPKQTSPLLNAPAGLRAARFPLVLRLLVRIACPITARLCSEPQCLVCSISEVCWPLRCCRSCLYSRSLPHRP